MVMSQKLQQIRAHGVKGHRKGARNWFFIVYYFVRSHLDIWKGDRKVAERIS